MRITGLNVTDTVNLMSIQLVREAEGHGCPGTWPASNSDRA